MFLGTHEHALDDKGRVIMPSRFRPQLEGGVVMVPWFEDCVAIFPREEFQRVMEKLETFPEGMEEKRFLERVLMGLAYEAVPDRQGRLTIPPRLRQIAGLEREVAIVGLKNRVEIWDRARWEETLAVGWGKSGEMASKIAQLGF
ncbi:MAG: division/cell wall cluster transcriptional repressor MraZ [Candidatus Geothermincolales bacterium]